MKVHVTVHNGFISRNVIKKSKAGKIQKLSALTIIDTYVSYISLGVETFFGYLTNPGSFFHTFLYMFMKCELNLSLYAV